MIVGSIIKRINGFFYAPNYPGVVPVIIPGIPLPLFSLYISFLILYYIILYYTMSFSDVRNSVYSPFPLLFSVQSGFFSTENTFFSTEKILRFCFFLGRSWSFLPPPSPYFSKNSSDLYFSGRKLPFSGQKLKSLQPSGLWNKIK